MVTSLDVIVSTTEGWIPLKLNAADEKWRLKFYLSIAVSTSNLRVFALTDFPVHVRDKTNATTSSTYVAMLFLIVRSFARNQ